MMELRINVPEVKEYIKGIAEAPGKIFQFVRYNVKESVGKYLSELMEAELSVFIGRERYQRDKGRGGEL
ncbi:conserved hypothetical protein [Candidatus Brocadia pituitae]|nr:conserved hypothetical protein [Candidatus Brocadia pituitae]